MLRQLYYADAIREALQQEMRRDDSVYVYGEDVAAYGGVFGVTKGLVDEFGPMRVRNTPLSEAAILGEAVGAAVYGLRPVPEIQFSDFLTTGLSPLVDLAASYHYRIGTPLPITVRAPAGGGLNIGNFHSRCFENWFVGVPGLKVVIPSTAHDAKGLLIASIRDNNPVLFFEQKKLYREIKDDVPEELYTVELGKAAIRREGKDISVFTYGSPVYLALQAAKELEKKGIQVEVIDLRTLMPLDKETILVSFKKTNRALILHEAPKTGGFGGEVAGLLAEEGFDSIAAPIIRIGAKHMPIPTNPVLENYYLPSLNDVLAAADQLMRY
ncbi:MAG TPA: alpha-ketoacid dehydrogenase subunit beta [Deltaproteobacteria bacterium]|nr:alpha-ketoacid dehydrogenase subunit beta [Deltaproteobacteria bacterium]